MPALVMRAPAGQPARPDLPPRGPAPDRVRRASAACPGASPSRPTTRATSSSPTSTRTSACRASDSSAGLGEDLVVAPYATALAAMVDPRRPRRNFAAPRARRARAGRYGFYEALDYTPVAAARGQRRSPSCSAYMAHHQGMTPRRARQRPARRRRHARALPRRADRPGDRAAAAGARAARRRGRPAAGRGGRARRRTSRELVAAGRPPLHVAARRRLPRTHLLSNGRYAVMLTDGGLGLQPLRATSRHPLARGRHARLLGDATSSCATSRAARSGRPATSRPAPSPTSYEVDLLRGPRGVPSPRRRDRDHARGRRLARGRRRGAPGLDHEPRRRSRARSS